MFASSHLFVSRVLIKCNDPEVRMEKTFTPLRPSFRQCLLMKEHQRIVRLVSFIAYPSTAFPASDAEHDTPYLSGDNTESSSNSSLSNTRYGSFESPCASLETVPMSGLGRSPSDASSSAIHQSHYQADSDLDADPNPDWQSRVDAEVLSSLSDRDKQRQDVLNELFNTERSHVQKLKVLSRVFHRPMLENNLAPANLLNGLFSNLDEMLEIHGRFSERMKQMRRAKVVTGDSGSPTGAAPSKDGPGCWNVIGEVGDLLLSMFDGEAGERLAEAAAKFCQSQSIALIQLRMKEKENQKLKNFLLDAASNPLCRRQQLKDFIPLGMQRLTKYPLLLENLVKCSGPSSPSDPSSSDTDSLVSNWDEEISKIKRASAGSRQILDHVNQAKKEFENNERLSEIQKRLDTSSFDKTDHPVTKQYRPLELDKCRMVHEGRVTWKVSNNPQKSLDLHMVLTDQFVMLLQKDGDKFHLKYHSITSVAGKDDNKHLYSPIISCPGLLVRQVATDKKAFFLVMNLDSGPQMYHIISPSVQECRTALYSMPLPAISFKFPVAPFIACSAYQVPCCSFYRLFGILGCGSNEGFRFMEASSRVRKSDVVVGFVKAGG
ncbi:unnamed protein product [Notodromas monacha]|uniref:DH domain-containing protein n=1 Tax=Notodromas monacha TaxID=399045 RepID=A0A7R9BGB8_9CRUS|nr:unnamed protein product [Notodromas monacha]CAG0914094.1 unnamed protein product [Notodromas monacha]